MTMTNICNTSFLALLLVGLPAQAGQISLASEAAPIVASLLKLAARAPERSPRRSSTTPFS